MGVLRILIALFMVTMFQFNVTSQNTIEGKIIDGETLEPLMGAKIVVLGTKNQAISQFEGS